MFDKRLLASSELYEKRYKNFPVLLIFPVAFLFVGLFIFSFFAKKELIVTNIASIEPQKVISNIQSTSNNPIIENYLSEGKTVQANSLLLKYNNDSDSTLIKNLMNQKQELLNKKEQLQLLLKSLTSGKNEFQVTDAYGYEKTFESYEAQSSSLRENISKSNRAIDDQNNNILNQQSAISRQIANVNNQIDAYIEIQNAVSNNGTVSSRNPYIAQYNNYLIQRKAIESRAQNQEKLGEISGQDINKQTESLKAQFLAGISSSIDSLREQVQSFDVQMSGLNASNSYDYSLNSQLLTLKTQALASANKELSDFNSALTDLETKISLQKQANKYNEIFAEKEGVLHVLPNILENKTIPVGTPIAQIYPPLKNKTQVYLVSYIPSTQISGIKRGQKVRFTIQQNLPKTEILIGTIYQIDSAPTPLKNGNAYKVSALVTLDKKELSYIRYGLEGKCVVITGQKTYFNYYLDKIKGESS
ncbi:bacteriocin secretion accessory protein [Lactococcus ileimucosae]|uniref:bacteriocin secretion accessory protein n=1 Tax=Lactococcus ileimucosae TaxID=2941329 RepID=UPI00351267C6